MEIVHNSILAVMYLTPEKYMVGVLLAVGIITLAPIFAVFFTWKKLFPKYYNRKFDDLNDQEYEIFI